MKINFDPYGSKSLSEPPCFTYGSVYSGSPVSTVSSVPDAPACQQECLEAKECKAFSYNPETRECRLVGPRETLSPDPR